MRNGTRNWAASNPDSPGLIFLSMAGLYFFANFQRVGVPGTVFDEIQTEFGATASGVTALAAIFLWVYAGMQVFIGAGADRFGPARMVLAGGTLLTVGSVCFPLCKSLTALYVCRAVVGLGASFMYISIIKEIVNIFESRLFPPLLGVLLVIGYSGGLVATAPLERSVRAVGWRGSFFLAAILCAGVFVAVFVLLARAGRIRRERSTFSLASVKRLLGIRGIYPLLAAGSINFGIYYVLQVTIGKKALEDCCGLGSHEAAGVTAAMILVVTLGYFAGGFIPRLAGERRKPFVVAASTIVLAGAALLLAGTWSAKPAWWIGAGFITLAVNNCPAIVGTSLLKEITPPSTAAFAIGILNATCYFSVAVASSLVGLVMDAFATSAVRAGDRVIYPVEAYRWMFAGMLALAAVSVVVSLFTPETRGVQQNASA